MIETEKETMTGEEKVSMHKITRKKNNGRREQSLGNGKYCGGFVGLTSYSERKEGKKEKWRGKKNMEERRQQ